MTRFTLPFLIALLLPTVGLARSPAEGNDLAPLLEAARIEGQSSGTLGGAVATRLRGMGIEQPVEVAVRRLYWLREPGCARLSVAFDQRNVTLPGETAPKDRHAEFAMNRCTSGRPPASKAGAQPTGEGQP